MTRRNLISRRTLLQRTAASAALGLTPALAQNAAGWPDHQIRMVVPYPAGGSTDVLFRILAERLKDKLGQSVVVENKPGASGNIGIDQIGSAWSFRIRRAARPTCCSAFSLSGSRTSSVSPSSSRTSLAPPATSGLIRSDPHGRSVSGGRLDRRAVPHSR